MDKSVQVAFENIAPIIESNGYRVVDIEFKEYYGRKNLIFFIDKDGGVSLDDCEIVNNLICEPIEKLENDINDGKEYFLSVSSPGLDRPFKTDNDFERNIGKDIEITMRKLNEGATNDASEKKEKISGTLSAFDNDSVTIIDGKGKEKIIVRNNIKKTTLLVKF